MKIKGANLGEMDVELASLSSHILVDDSLLPIIQYLENMYYNLVEQSKTSEIHEFPCKDGKVCIMPGMINHSCSNNPDILKAIAQYGVLASEWFGVLESEKEGRFCTFIDRIKPDDYRDTWDNYRRFKSPGNNVLLFFDMENELMQSLLHLDYFEYEKLKSETPDKISEMYSPEEIALFEKLIEPLSPAGRSFHSPSKSQSRFYYWSAIPGGIPAALVNGVCLRNNQYDEEYIKMITGLFPNATIFDGDLNIIYKPEKKISDSKVI